MVEALISVTPLVVIGTLMLSAMVVGILALQEPSRPRTEQPMHLEDVDKEIIEKLAQEVLKGTFCNGETRKQALGALYNKVQSRVNQILEAK